MPDTGESGEVSRFVNEKEQEVIREAKTAASKAKQQSTKAGRAIQSRKRRNAPRGLVEAMPKSGQAASDRAASDRIIDEGGPSSGPAEKTVKPRALAAGPTALVDVQPVQYAMEDRRQQNSRDRKEYDPGV